MEAMEHALVRELRWKLDNAIGPVSTIYFGGGTPSLFPVQSLKRLMQICLEDRDAPSEVTLEANPEDITSERLEAWLDMGINRLSIGVQTFDDDRLKWMNRAHTGQQAIDAIRAAHSAGFQHLSADLIYGLPDRKEPFTNDLEKATALPVDHMSAYILTVEDRTVLGRNVQKGIDTVAPEALVELEYEQLSQCAKAEGFDHYEVSNFARSGGHARHNQHYWTGMPFLGIGPGAHGFDGKVRSANVSNNPAYIASVTKASHLSEMKVETDPLTAIDRYNEVIMTGLRTARGIDLNALASEYGLNPKLEEPLLWNQCIQDNTLIALGNDCFRISEEKWLIADRISSAFFALQ